MVTAQTDTQGLDETIRLAREQLPTAHEHPGFQGYYLLTDEESGKIMTVSLWETREHMEAVGQGTADGVHDQGVEAADLTTPRLETYEVTMRA